MVQVARAGGVTKGIKGVLGSTDLQRLVGYGLQRIRRNPLWLLVLVLLGGGWYAYEVQIARPAMAYMGVPQVFRPGPEGWVRVLRNEAFIAGYSEWLGNALWVTYQVQPRPTKMQSLPRPSRFDTDMRTLRCLTVIACVDHDDYTGTGYDRGHLAPNHVIASRYGKRAQHETFLMTNISPQRPALNRQVWQRLEAIAEDDFARRFGAFWVVTGPIFGEKPQWLPGGIAVPDAFYKILIRPEPGGGAPRVLAFVVPQTVKGTEDLRTFLASIDDIERWTGIDFFHALPDDIEDAIERQVDPAAWEFSAEMARRVPRYR